MANRGDLSVGDKVVLNKKGWKLFGTSQFNAEKRSECRGKVVRINDYIVVVKWRSNKMHDRIDGILMDYVDRIDDAE